MITRRQSFLVSFGAHTTLVIILLVVTVFFAKRAMGPRPIQLELQPPVQVSSEQDQGAQQDQPDKPKPKPKITERTIEERFPSPNAPFNPDNIPDIKEETFKEYELEGIITPIDGAPTDTASNYAALISNEIKRNWDVPGLGVRGPTVPRVEVAVTVARSGKIMGYRVTRPSGNPAFDRSATEAVRLSNPLLPFPPEMPGAQEVFTFEFVPDE